MLFGVCMKALVSGADLPAWLSNISSQQLRFFFAIKLRVVHHYDDAHEHVTLAKARGSFSNPHDYPPISRIVEIRSLPQYVVQGLIRVAKCFGTPFERNALPCVLWSWGRIPPQAVECPGRVIQSTNLEAVAGVADVLGEGTGSHIA